jgi:hypothetical protein
MSMSMMQTSMPVVYIVQVTDHRMAVFLCFGFKQTKFEIYHELGSYHVDLN